MDTNQTKNFIEDHIKQGAEQIQSWLDELKTEDEQKFNEINELLEKIKEKLKETNSN